jgi:hypothetical protein
VWRLNPGPCTWEATPLPLSHILCSFAVYFQTLEESPTSLDFILQFSQLQVTEKLKFFQGKVIIWGQCRIVPNTTYHEWQMNELHPIITILTIWGILSLDCNVFSNEWFLRIYSV